MRLRLSEHELLQVVSSLDFDTIKSYSEGEFKKWNVKKIDSGEYEFEYKYDNKGNLKEE